MGTVDFAPSLARKKNTGFSSYGRAAQSLALNKYTPLENVHPIAQKDRKDLEEAHPTVGIGGLSSVIREKLFAKLIENNTCDISKYSSDTFSLEKGSVKVLKNQRLLRDLIVSIPYLCEIDCLPVR